MKNKQNKLVFFAWLFAAISVMGAVEFVSRIILENLETSLISGASIGIVTALLLDFGFGTWVVVWIGLLSSIFWLFGIFSFITFKSLRKLKSTRSIQITHDREDDSEANSRSKVIAALILLSAISIATVIIYESPEKCFQNKVRKILIESRSEAGKAGDGLENVFWDKDSPKQFTAVFKEIVRDSDPDILSSDGRKLYFGMIGAFADCGIDYKK